MMVAVRLTAILGQDRKLTIQLPPEMPLGPVELVVSSQTEAAEKIAPTLTREEAIARLRAARQLAEVDFDVTGVVPLTQEEIWELGRPLLPGRPMHELVDEDRGEW